MKIIGITGGVGAGKSEILSYLQATYHARVLLADVVANELKAPGQACYEPIIALLGKEILADDGTIDNRKMAQAMFGNEEMRAAVGNIIHPAVRQVIERRIEEARTADAELFFLEAALLIEEKYDEIVDEMWYIYTSEAVRKKRLRESRGYSDEKITAIMDSQLSEASFRAACDFVIDNSYSLEETKKQIDRKMGEL